MWRWYFSEAFYRTGQVLQIIDLLVIEARNICIEVTFDESGIDRNCGIFATYSAMQQQYPAIMNTNMLAARWLQTAFGEEMNLKNKKWGRGKLKMEGDFGG